MKEDMCMKYYVRKPLYLQTDTSCVGLSATLLQVRDDQSCGYDVVPDNAMFWPTSFTSKSLSSTEDKHSNKERSMG